MPCNVVVGSDCWCAFRSRGQTVIYSDFPLAHILCQAVPFKTAPALQCFLPNISITWCFLICRALLRLAPGSTLPALQRECQLRSSTFPNQNDNLSLRCFSRKAENYSFSRLVPSLLWDVVAGVPSNPTILLISLLPADAQLCIWNTAPALEYFLSNISSTWCFPIRKALLRLVPGSALPALQRECQLRSSAFANQTNNLSLGWCSRKSKNYSFSRLVCLHCYIMVGGDEIPEPNL